MGYAELSFTQGSNLWPAIDVADYTEGNAIGRSRAEELVAYIRQEDAPMMLGYVVGAIVAQGAMGSVEIGFCHRVATALMPAASEPSRASPNVISGGQHLRLCGGKDTVI